MDGFIILIKPKHNFCILLLLYSSYFIKYSYENFISFCSLHAIIVRNIGCSKYCISTNYKGAKEAGKN